MYNNRTSRDAKISKPKQLKNETIRELCVICVKGTLTYDFPKIVAQFESHVLLCFVVTYSLYGLIMKCCCHVKIPPAVRLQGGFSKSK